MFLPILKLKKTNNMLICKIPLTSLCNCQYNIINKYNVHEFNNTNSNSYTYHFFSQW